jgi:predicted kinase
VEFNDAISCIDVMYDLAFLLMDLGRLSLWSHANVLLNTYLADTLDFDSLAALPLFLACRAGVRAKTVATAATFQDDGGRQASLAAQARNYLALAERLIDPPPAALVAIGGLSGAGKSALALAITPDVGPPPGAVVIRSDEVRKQLFGVAPLTRLGAESYTRGASSRVYSLITARAGSVLSGRHAAIVDATFLNAADRFAIEAVARSVGVPFVGLWLKAPEGARLDRVQRRLADPSDADASVILHQSVDGSVDWTHVDASRPLDLVAGEARRSVAAAGALRRT